MEIVQLLGELVDIDTARNYIGLPDNSRDDFLEKCLHKAHDYVIQTIEKPVVQMVITEQGYNGLTAKYPVQSTVSVQNDNMDDIVDYTVSGREFTFAGFANVTYQTKQVHINGLEPAILAITGLFFDGVTEPEAWNNVINSYLSHYVKVL